VDGDVGIRTQVDGVFLVDGLEHERRRTTCRGLVEDRQHGGVAGLVGDEQL
jgi:hypothetical protein